MQLTVAGRRLSAAASKIGFLSINAGAADDGFVMNRQKTTCHEWTKKIKIQSFFQNFENSDEKLVAALRLAIV